MRSVRSELFLTDQRLLQPGQQVVDRASELGNFIIWLSDGNTLIEVALGDEIGLLDDLLNRQNTLTRQKPHG